MTRPPRKPHDQYIPTAPEPRLSPDQLGAIADRILSGDVYQAGSVNELAALLAVLRKRGYVPKHRTERERSAAPWLITVIEEAQIVTPPTTEDDKSRLDNDIRPPRRPIPCAAENE